MNEKIVVGYLSTDNPKDRKSWSGTHYRMLNALEQEGLVVKILGPLKLNFIVSLYLKLKGAFHKVRTGKKFNKNHCIIRSKSYAKEFSKKINNQHIDILFAPAGSVIIAYLKTEIPICYLGDTSFNQIKDYYGAFTGFSKKSIKESNLIERLAIHNSHVQIYPSHWAADYVKSYYKAKNTKVIKFGANIDKAPTEDEIIKDYTQTIKILFLGVDWERKGGDIALKAIDILSKTHTNFEFTVCGCRPPNGHLKMNVIPFLNKNITAEREEFHNLLCSHHILLLPTRAEAFGIVFCEANAYGLPIITTKTGGIESVISEGINGFALHPESTVDDYAHKLKYLIENKSELKRLALSSRIYYEQELNWETWGQSMKKAFQDVLTTNIGARCKRFT